VKFAPGKIPSGAKAPEDVSTIGKKLIKEQYLLHMSPRDQTGPLKLDGHKL